jgi:hypothetical protein
LVDRLGDTRIVCVNGARVVDPVEAGAAGGGPAVPAGGR